MRTLRRNSFQMAWRLPGPLLAIALASLPAVRAQAQEQTSPKSDGTVAIQGVEVPLSILLSPEGAAYLRHMIVDQPFANGPRTPDIKIERAYQTKIMGDFLTPMLKRYPVRITQERIGGVINDIIVPAQGIAPGNQDRILINLHGGGFRTGGRSASLVESVPIAALMGIKVVSIDYRMSPEARFPAANEDVEAVYRELLKSYAPSKIGIFGCSAGGLLTAEVIAWFDAKGLPQPAAAGVFCASLGRMFIGDSGQISGALMGFPPRPLSPSPEPAKPEFEYLASTGPNDPLAYPVLSPALLKKFPPTLFVTGTRSFEFSAALDSQNKLAAAGVPTRFFAWDGMPHAFFYNSELPESREAFDRMVEFFGTYLAK